MSHDETIKVRALDWAVRTADPEFTDWEGFTNWLEEDAAHAEAYDAISASAADAADAIAQIPQAANDDPRTIPQVRRRWVMGALVASLALVASFSVWQTGNGPYSVNTAPGEFRTVALADGGSVVLSGGTSLEFDPKNPRFARLESGQALFTIHHDETNPFAVEVGKDRLVDAGTVFDVLASEGSMQVAVSEGLVIFNPGKQNVKVAPGRMLKADGHGYAITAIPPEQVGEWRSGRLTFEGAPLSVVAERLSRMTGIVFAAEGEGGSFSGSLSIAPLRKDPQSLGALLGARMRHEDGRWIISVD